MASPENPAPPALSSACVAEALGTFLLVFLGTGSVHAAVLTGAQQGVWQVAVVWAIAVALAIYATAAISGAHLNPAMTMAFAAFGGFPWKRVVPYAAAQLAGAVAAAALLSVIFAPQMGAFERAAGIERGAAGSERSAMCYGEYFPNPGTGVDAAAWARVPETSAILAELSGTAVLAFVIFALTERRNASAPGAALTPAAIGFTVAALISLFAPLTQAGFNPARDFGPRLVAYALGWGAIAIPGPRGGFFSVYIAAPIAGALLGTALFRATLGRSYRAAV